MSEQLQSDFDKLVKTSKFSNEEIEFKKNFKIISLKKVFLIESKKIGSF